MQSIIKRFHSLEELFDCCLYKKMLMGLCRHSVFDCPLYELDLIQVGTGVFVVPCSLRSKAIFYLSGCWGDPQARKFLSQRRWSGSGAAP